MTIKEYIIGSVNYKVDEGAIESILIRRDVDGAQEYQPQSIEGVSVELLRADLLKWIVLGPSRTGDVSDSDNGWSHKEGGMTLSAKDKKMLRDEANAIYEAAGETSSTFGKVHVKVTSGGIMPAMRAMDGRPLRRIINN